MPENLKPKVILFDFYRTLVDITTDEGRYENWDCLARFLSYQGCRVAANVLRDDFFTQTRINCGRRNEKFPEVDIMEVLQAILWQYGYNAPSSLIVSLAYLFRSMSMVHFSVYGDTIKVLSALRNRFELGLVSDAQRVFFDRELDMAGLAGLWNVVVVSSDYGFHKPDPRLFQTALAQLGTQPDEAVYVGDSSTRDIQGARNAGIRSVLLRRSRQRNDDDRYPPDMTITGLEELLGFF